MKPKFHLPEATHRAVMRTIAHVSWWSALLVTVLRVTDSIPTNFGPIVVLLIGTGVSASVSLTRARLADTITSAFDVGLRLSQNGEAAVMMRLREAHQAVDLNGHQVCGGCGEHWPCTTMKIIES